MHDSIHMANRSNALHMISFDLSMLGLVDWRPFSDEKKRRHTSTSLMSLSERLIKWSSHKAVEFFFHSDVTGSFAYKQLPHLISSRDVKLRGHRIDTISLLHIHDNSALNDHAHVKGLHGLNVVLWTYGAAGAVSCNC
jgi:hypothetical protein